MSMKCKWCCSDFEQKRPTQEFCGKNCRKYWNNMNSLNKQFAANKKKAPHRGRGTDVGPKST